MKGIEKIKWISCQSENLGTNNRKSRKFKLKVWNWVHVPLPHSSMLWGGFRRR